VVVEIGDRVVHRPVVADADVFPPRRAQIGEDLVLWGVG
jgi:hypothetical protein